MGRALSLSLSLSRFFDLSRAEIFLVEAPIGFICVRVDRFRFLIAALITHFSIASIVRECIVKPAHDWAYDHLGI